MKVTHYKHNTEIKPEKLQEYTDKLVAELRRTSLIILFTRNLHRFMPKYNELKHFNAPRVVETFLYQMKEEEAEMTRKQNEVTFY